ncbi:MAG: RdgB/HAM1 family non-canonical purine NTP pyrophosphatase [Desulfovibrionaceae bacterium]|nr:RdgB/HAM1 family non-canonical purine NTP pyrophosphatase [Desulfovibrionaceae bacterium]
MRPALVLATRNPGKIKELSALLQGFGLEVLGLDQVRGIGDIPETGTTFLENARIKARTVALATGLCAVADDSGLEVDALNGAPGVYSARYSGPDADDDKNNLKLLRELEAVPEAGRTARFVCSVVAASPSGIEIASRGVWEGRIASSPRGSQGFGFDPLFFDPELGLTAAQMTGQQKNSRSHRGKALAGLLAQWPGFWARVRSG